MPACLRLGTLAALLLLAVPAAVAINSFAGPYIAYGRHYYACGENCGNTTWTWKMRTTHFNPMQPNELQRITGYMNIPAVTGPMSDSIIALARLDTRSNNQWKENAFVGNLQGACSNTRNHIPDVFRVLFGGRAMKGKCEIPPGNYTFVNEPIKWVFVKFPIFPYGEYRFRLSFVKTMTSAPMLCLCVDAQVIPRL